MFPCIIPEGKWIWLLRTVLFEEANKKHNLMLEMEKQRLILVLQDIFTTRPV